MVTPASGSPSILPDSKKRKVGSEPAARPQPLDKQINSLTLSAIQGASSSNSRTPVGSSINNASDITASAWAVSNENFSVASMTMTEFVNGLNDEPLKTYKSLLKELVHHGVNFPFRPYREILETTQEYLKRRADYSVSTTAQRLYASMSDELKKNPEPGFSSTKKLLYELVHVYPGSSNSKVGDYEEKNPQYEEFEAIRLRKGEDLVIFSFITQNNLDLMFFVNARCVPVYALGLAQGEDLHPSPYDDNKNPTRKEILLHDVDHMMCMVMDKKVLANGHVKYHIKYNNELEEILKSNKTSEINYHRSINTFQMKDKHTESDEDPESHKKFLKEILENLQYNLKVLETLLASMPDKTPLIAHSLRLQRFNKELLAAPPELQKPLEALAFHIFHDRIRGVSTFDPVFIAKVVLFNLVRESRERIDFSTIDRDEFGIRSFVNCCSKTVNEELSGDFFYPPEYKTPEVISRLPEAADWMFEFLNKERLYQESEMGRREENCPEQQELDVLMQKAVQKINKAL